jgi:hypothetical protein
VIDKKNDAHKKNVKTVREKNTDADITEARADEIKEMTTIRRASRSCKGAGGDVRPSVKLVEARIQDEVVIHT